MEQDESGVSPNYGHGQHQQHQPQYHEADPSVGDEDVVYHSTEPYNHKNQVILASAGYDHSIRFWDVDKGYCDRIIQNSDNMHVSCLLFTFVKMQNNFSPFFLFLFHSKLDQRHGNHTEAR